MDVAHSRPSTSGGRLHRTMIDADFESRCTLFGGTTMSNARFIMASPQHEQPDFYKTVMRSELSKMKESALRRKTLKNAPPEKVLWPLVGRDANGCMSFFDFPDQMNGNHVPGGSSRVASYSGVSSSQRYPSDDFAYLQPRPITTNLANRFGPGPDQAYHSCSLARNGTLPLGSVRYLQ